MKNTSRKNETGGQAGRAASWEHFSHVADVGIRGFGASMGSAFEQAAKALTATVTDPEAIRPGTSIKITCSAPDPELLLVSRDDDGRWRAQCIVDV